MGTGKTNLGRFLCVMLKKLGFMCYYARVQDPSDVEEMLWYAARTRKSDRLMIFFDDASGTLSGKSSKVRAVEAAITQARHIVGTGDSGRLVLVFAFHHVGLINPVFRISPMYALTSISSTWEVKLLSREGYFPRDKLEEYLAVYTGWVYREKWLVKMANKLNVDIEKSKPVLFRVWDSTEIQFVPIVRDDPWDHTLNEPPRERETERRPPISFQGFLELARNKLGIRARNEKLYKLYSYIFYDLLGYKKPGQKEEEN